ncbi:glycosyltransferase family A protein [Pseudoalteromonas marina]|uniref:glycosyltransferase family A protein n=1 Tax=Pseudoalteromonas marina TaxID=267375 RepID=UPI002732E8AB|nr:glycosyltransferase family A protein [Pseudoalteromonas marina]MDP2485785.1 glycosyltransferase family A protein [Pseudoalteromonas marina]
MNICIAVVAFNKLKPLKRLLQSLSEVVIPKTLKVDLCFCIDGGGTPEIEEVAKDFNWHGENKKINVQPTNIGLKKNVYKTMKLGTEYDFLVILEDDLFISTQLLKYIESVAVFYGDSSYLGGYSLYSPNFNETAYTAFKPLNDNKDIYFMKVPSSWGQFYSKKQLENYFVWLENAQNVDLSSLPPNVSRWSDKSWKKEYFLYLIETGKYFLYPRNSLTTNFADAGVHHRGSDLYQVTLLIDFRDLNLVEINGSKCVYDEFCELEPECLNRQVTKLQNYNYTVDLYGYKPLDSATNGYQYILSTVCHGKALMSWDNSLIPLEMNILSDLSGEGIYLYKTENLKFKRLNIIRSRIKKFFKLHQIRIDSSLVSRLVGRN